MSLPSISTSINDPGIPRGGSADVVITLVGCATAGDTTRITTATRPEQITDEYTSGPLARAGLHVLRFGGAPVRLLRLPTAVVAAATAVTKTGTGLATMAVSAASCNDRYGVRFYVVTGGGLGDAVVKYAADFWDGGADAGGVPETYSGNITVPVSGVVTLTGTGLSVTFNDSLGDLVAGDTYDFTTTGPCYDAAGITAASSIFEAYGLPWDASVFIGQEATAALASADATAVDGVMTSLFNANSHKQALVDASLDTAATVGASTLVTTFESIRTGAHYGECQVTAQKPLIGVSSVRIPYVAALAARIGSNLISTDPIRVASGPLPGVLAITHDEFAEQNLDALKIGTARTWPNANGFYVTNAWIKSAAASDFRYVQHATVANRVCDAVVEAQTIYVGASIRAKADGTISEEDASNIERAVRATLSARFTQPLNAEGTRGHVSFISYDIDRTINLVATETIEADVGIVPLGYPRTINTRVGFRVQIA